MLKKFTNKKGFTLMEMLIVVAIIAVLVAIAIPTFTGQLERANQSTDLANVRAAYAEAVVKQLESGKESKQATPNMKSASWDKIDQTLKVGNALVKDAEKAKDQPITIIVSADGVVSFAKGDTTGTP